MDWPDSDTAPPTGHALIHYSSAAVFFLAIAFVCVFCSRATLKFVHDAAKRQRFGMVCNVLGATMVAVGAIRWGTGSDYSVLLVEWGGIYVFSIFWLAKSAEIKLIEAQSSRG